MGAGLDNLKWCIENWKVLFWLVTLALSLAGNGLLASDNIDKSDKLATSDDVLAIYVNEATRQWEKHDKPGAKTTHTTTIIRGGGCSKCDKLEKNMIRWHGAVK